MGRKRSDSDTPDNQSAGTGRMILVELVKGKKAMHLVTKANAIVELQNKEKILIKIMMFASHHYMSTIDCGNKV